MMDDFDKLTKGWKNVTADAAIENRKLFLNKNNSIMESVLTYENNEKSEKKKQIVLLGVVGIVWALVFAWWMWMDGFQFSTKNLIGFILLLIGTGFSIISNKTDDFPDARTLESLKYLKKKKTHCEFDHRDHNYPSRIILDLLQYPYHGIAINTICNVSFRRFCWRYGCLEKKI